MTTTYTVPTNPADPEAAALDLIVQLPAQLLGTSAFTEVLQNFCGLLHAEGALAGLSWNDARQVVQRCRWTPATTKTRPTSSATGRAVYSRGTDRMAWQDRQGTRSGR